MYFSSGLFPYPLRTPECSFLSHNIVVLLRCWLLWQAARRWEKYVAEWSESNGTRNRIAWNRRSSCHSTKIIRVLILSQMTNFRLFQTERVCRRQF